MISITACTVRDALKTYAEAPYGRSPVANAAHETRLMRALIQLGFVTDAQLTEARCRARTSGGAVAEELVSLGAVQPVRLAEVVRDTAPAGLALALLQNAERRRANAMCVRHTPRGATVCMRVLDTWLACADLAASVVDDVVADLRGRALPALVDDGPFGADIEVAFVSALRAAPPLFARATDAVRLARMLGGVLRLEPEADGARVRVARHDGAPLFFYPAHAHEAVRARLEGKRIEEPGPHGARVVVVS